LRGLSPILSRPLRKPAPLARIIATTSAKTSRRLKREMNMVLVKHSPKKPCKYDVCGERQGVIELRGFRFQSTQLCEECAQSLTHVLLQDPSDLNHGLIIVQDQFNKPEALPRMFWLQLAITVVIPRILKAVSVATSGARNAERG